MDLLKVFGWIWVYFEKSSYFIAVNILKLATYLTDVQPIARTREQTRAPCVAGEKVGLYEYAQLSNDGKIKCICWLHLLLYSKKSSKN